MLLLRRPGALAARRGAALLARAGLSTRAPTLDTPFISDTIPLAEGVLGTVEELLEEGKL